MTVLNREKILDNVAIGNLVQLEAKEFDSPCMWPSLHCPSAPAVVGRSRRFRSKSFPSLYGVRSYVRLYGLCRVAKFPSYLCTTSFYLLWRGGGHLNSRPRRRSQVGRCILRVSLMSATYDYVDDRSSQIYSLLEDLAIGGPLCRWREHRSTVLAKLRASLDQNFEFKPDRLDNLVETSRFGSLQQEVNKPGCFGQFLHKGSRRIWQFHQDRWDLKTLGKFKVTKSRSFLIFGARAE